MPHNERIKFLMDELSHLMNDINLAITEAVQAERERMATEHEKRVAKLIEDGSAANRANAESFRRFERDRCVEIAKNFRWDGSPWAEAAPIIGAEIAKLLGDENG